MPFIQKNSLHPTPLEQLLQCYMYRANKPCSHAIYKDKKELGDITMYCIGTMLQYFYCILYIIDSRETLGGKVGHT